MRSRQLLVIVPVALAGVIAIGYFADVGGLRTGPAAGPDDYVLSVPGMH